MTHLILHVGNFADGKATKSYQIASLCSDGTYSIDKLSTSNHPVSLDEARTRLRGLLSMQMQQIAEVAGKC